ncbi:hypothetical protein HDU96_006769 [Phlyctochytrium bullatum]|nr:hypothetical protein HDU96_006769 [Phlyctochytrium bullatum]
MACLSALPVELIQRIAEATQTRLIRVPRKDAWTYPRGPWPPSLPIGAAKGMPAPPAPAISASAQSTAAAASLQNITTAEEEESSDDEEHHDTLPPAPPPPHPHLLDMAVFSYKGTAPPTAAPVMRKKPVPILAFQDIVILSSTCRRLREALRDANLGKRYLAADAASVQIQVSIKVPVSPYDVFDYGYLVDPSPPAPLSDPTATPDSPVRRVSPVTEIPPRGVFLHHLSHAIGPHPISVLHEVWVRPSGVVEVLRRRLPSAVACVAWEKLETWEKLEGLKVAGNGPSRVAWVSDTHRETCGLCGAAPVAGVRAHVDKNYRVFMRTWLDSHTLLLPGGLKVTLDLVHESPADAEFLWNASGDPNADDPFIDPPSTARSLSTSPPRPASATPSTPLPPPSYPQPSPLQSTSPIRARRARPLPSDLSPALRTRPAGSWYPRTAQVRVSRYGMEVRGRRTGVHVEAFFGVVPGAAGKSLREVMEEEEKWEREEDVPMHAHDAFVCGVKCALPPLKAFEVIVEGIISPHVIVPISVKSANLEVLDMIQWMSLKDSLSLQRAVISVQDTWTDGVLQGLRVRAEIPAFGDHFYLQISCTAVDKPTLDIFDPRYVQLVERLKNETRLSPDHLHSVDRALLPKGSGRSAVEAYLYHEDVRVLIVVPRKTDMDLAADFQSVLLNKDIANTLGILQHVLRIPCFMHNLPSQYFMVLVRRSCVNAPKNEAVGRALEAALAIEAMTKSRSAIRGFLSTPLHNNELFTQFCEKRGR